MVFFTHYSKKRDKTLFLLMIVLALGASLCRADEIKISKKDARQTEDGFQISAEFSVSLTPTIENALTHGVPLYFVTEVAITKTKWYWLDAEIIKREQVSKLSYNALTQQYRLARGQLFQSFYELQDALQVIGRVYAEASYRIEADEENDGYWEKMQKIGNSCCDAYVYMHLDTKQLPKPLQVNALTNSDWTLESTRQHWTFQISSEKKE